MKKKMLKIINNRILNIFFFLTIIVALNFFQNVFQTLKYTKEERLIKYSEFCEKDSLGYIVYLSNNYKFQGNPKIINNLIYPSNHWYYYDFKKNDNSDEFILLNYNEFENLNTNYFKEEYIIKETPTLANKITSIEINLYNPLRENIEFIMKIYRYENEIKKELYEEAVNLKKGLAKKIINIDLDISSGKKLRRYSVKFENKKKKFIKSVIFKIKNKIDLKNYKILDNKKNCFYIKKIND